MNVFPRRNPNDGVEALKLILSPQSAEGERVYGRAKAPRKDVAPVQGFAFNS